MNYGDRILEEESEYHQEPLLQKQNTHEDHCESKHKPAIPKFRKPAKGTGVLQNAHDRGVVLESLESENKTSETNSQVQRLDDKSTGRSQNKISKTKKSKKDSGVGNYNTG